MTTRSDRPRATSFDWLMLGLAAALAAGAYTDGWAHNHDAGIETFFTPWHALLYSSMLANGVVLALALLRGVRAGRPVTQALPRGYGLAFLGVVLFGVAGTLDMTWHLVFGIETGFSTLMSPTHLLLITSATLIVSGPLRAAWGRPGRSAGWPAVLSAALLLSVFTFWAQFQSPVVSSWTVSGSDEMPLWTTEELGVLAVMLASALLVGTVVPLVLRFRLPLGSVTAITATNALMMSVMVDASVVVVVFALGGVIGDALLLGLRPSAERPIPVRIFAAALPATTYAIYYLYLLGTEGIAWPVHVWTGAVGLAGAVGFLLGLLLTLPRVPTSPEIRAAAPATPARAIPGQAPAPRAEADSALPSP